MNVPHTPPSHPAQFRIDPTRLLAVITLVLVLTSLAASAPVQPEGGASAASSATGVWLKPPGISQIRHVVFIMKENRSFDVYFGQFPGADGATTGLLSNGKRIPLGHSPDQAPHDMGHDWIAAKAVINGGEMNGYDLNYGGNLENDYLAYTQLGPEDIPNYWAYAQNFVLADRMFTSQAGPSLPNHLYMIAGQSDRIVSIAVPPDPVSQSWGCDATIKQTVKYLQSDGSLLDGDPCIDLQTLGDVLDAFGVDWNFYSASYGVAGYQLNPYTNISHIRFGNEWAKRMKSETDFDKDALNGKLASVVWLTPPKPRTEHPPRSTCWGENWTVDRINSIMQGPDWDSTAIFLGWDDFGGYYDHVNPPVVDEFGLGPRAPFLIISPYAKGGTVVHTTYEFSSVLKFMETVFDLPSLNTRDTSANDMLDAFDFSQQPIPPLVLPQRACPIVSTTPSHFGEQLLGTTTKNQMVITNLSNQAVKVSSIVVKGDKGFSITSACSN